MRRRTKILIVGTVMAGAAVAPAIAQAGDQARDDNDRDVPITGPALEQASQIAIAHLGGGTVTGTEVEDEESYYEVEVTLENGRQVDVQLDAGFNVVDTEGDGDDSDD